MQRSKRQRTDYDSDASEDAVTVRSDIWFQDGNIVIQAQDTQFRVYQGTLCSASEVLKLAIEGLGDSKGVEGRPLIVLSDSSVDMTHVLRTLFFRWSFPSNEPWPFDAIVAFLRLGQKYKIKPLHDEGLSRLTAAFPPTVDGIVTNRYEKSISAGKPTSRQQLIIPTIVLARELELLQLLPAAFWLAVTHIDALIIEIITSTAESDRDSIILATRRLRVAYANYVFGWLDEAVVDCRQRAACSNAKLQQTAMLWKPPGAVMILYCCARPVSSLSRTRTKGTR
ncbi:hypothetical protein C8R47DRAFT_1144344 [Mycena vitilis]|nr:hypothetical protein C8R47DRAFT_1144344 [Mycena vitilis]